MATAEHTDPARRDRGYASAAALAGEDVVRRFRAALADVSPALADYVAEFIYGDLHNRPALSSRDRQLVTLAALATLGGCESEIRLHVGVSLRVGLTPTEIVEALLHLSAYAGFPRTINAMRAAREELAARGELPVPDGS